MDTEQLDGHPLIQRDDRDIQSESDGQKLASLFDGITATYSRGEEFFLSKEQKLTRGFYLEGRILPEGTIDIRFEGIPLPLAQAILRLVGKGKDGGEDQGDNIPDQCFNDDFPINCDIDNDPFFPMILSDDEDDEL
jgi:hypothetical protein